MSGPSATTIKRLFALSGNRCAFPGCGNSLFDQNGVLIADICHIAGAKPSAKRYDPSQTEDQRQGFSNLIVLCANHHRVIDSDELTYTRPALRDMKRVHEATATSDFVISEEQANSIAVFLGGAALGGAAAAGGVSQMVREMTDAIRAINDALPAPAFKEKGHGPYAVLIDALRYAPRGTFQVHSTDEPHRRLGEFFAEVFKAAGWRLIEGAKLELSRPPPTPLLTLFFILRDRNHISNARHAIEEVFGQCGFASDGGGTLQKDDGGYVLRIGFVVVAQS